ncbi:MAG: VOC family protein [Chitinophagaceae bacterium]
MNGSCLKKCLFVFFILFVSLLPVSNAQQRPPITGIAFVQLQVSDMKKAGVFYNSLMGYNIVPAKSMGGNNTHFFDARVNQRQLIRLQDDLPAGQDERLIGIAFQTTDAEGLRLYLQSKSVVVPAAVNKEPGILSFAVHDPDKHLVIFVQPVANAKGQSQNELQAPAISRRILHAGLTIASTQAANVFYADVLGFSEIWRGGSNDSITSWINMRVPEGTDYLEYMLVNGLVNRQQLGSMHHIALMVPDMQQAVDILGARAQKTGYPVAPPRIGRNNRWQLNLFDPDGTRIELMEPFTMR